MRRIPTLAAALFALALSGCGEKPGENDVPIQFSDIPPSVVEVAKKQLPGVKFESAYKETKNGEEVFELRGKTKEGKIRDVEVTSKGKVVEVN